MKVLVFGGAGFIGSHVVDAYIAAQHTVAVFDNFSSGKHKNLPANVTIFEGDITDAGAVTQALTAFLPDVINHHAAQISITHSVAEPQEDAKSNILGTLTILEAARALSPQPKIIYASSGGAMYGAPEDLPATEETVPKPMSPYGLSKYVGEQYIWLYARLHDMRATVLRYSNVYGPRQDPHGEAGVCAIFTERMLKDQQVIIYGDGSATRDYIYVGDVAAANIAALDNGDGEACNISTGVEVSTLQVYGAFKAATKSNLDARMEPPRIGEVARTFLQPAKARLVLKWSATVAFADGVAKTVAWNKRSS